MDVGRLHSYSLEYIDGFIIALVIGDVSVTEGEMGLIIRSSLSGAASPIMNFY